MKLLLLLILSLSFLGGCYSSLNYYNNKQMLKYNYMEKEYSYEDPEAQLRYNYLENRWEFTQ